MCSSKHCKESGHCSPRLQFMRRLKSEKETCHLQSNSKLASVLNETIQKTTQIFRRRGIEALSRSGPFEWSTRRVALRPQASAPLQSALGPHPSCLRCNARAYASLGGSLLRRRPCSRRTPGTRIHWPRLCSRRSPSVSNVRHYFGSEREGAPGQSIQYQQGIVTGASHDTHVCVATLRSARKSLAPKPPRRERRLPRAVPRRRSVATLSLRPPACDPNRCKQTCSSLVAAFRRMRPISRS